MNQVEISQEKLRLEVEMARAVKEFNEARYQMQKAGQMHDKLNSNYALLLSSPDEYFKIKRIEELHKIFVESKWNAFLSRNSKELPVIFHP